MCKNGARVTHMERTCNQETILIGHTIICLKNFLEKRNKKISKLCLKISRKILINFSSYAFNLCFWLVNLLLCSNFGVTMIVYTYPVMQIFHGYCFASAMSNYKNKISNVENNAVLYKFFITFEPRLC